MEFDIEFGSIKNASLSDFMIIEILPEIVIESDFVPEIEETYLR
jgi:hypothetical protein